MYKYFFDIYRNGKKDRPITQTINRQTGREFYYIGFHQSGSTYTMNTNDISLLFCKGKGYFEYGQKKISFFAGNIFAVKGSYKFFLSNENMDTTVIALRKEYISDLFLAQIADCPLIYDFFTLSDEAGEYLYFDSVSEIIISHYIQALEYEAKNYNYQSHKIVESAGIQFFTKLHRTHQQTLVISESSMMPKYGIGEILSYLSFNYKTATLTSVAEHFNYHPAYFSTLFQKLAYCNFSTKLREIRLEQAKRLLLNTSFTVQEISEQVGFKDKSHFYRSFKKEFGMTPREYRLKLVK